MTERRSVVAWGQDWEGGITKGREKVLEVIVNYLDCGNNFMGIYCQTLIQVKYVQFIVHHLTTKKKLWQYKKHLKRAFIG